jgi:hypothetical protein
MEFTSELLSELRFAIDLVVKAFGRKNTCKFWVETRGFKTNVNAAMKKYPIIDGSVPHDNLMNAIKRLSEFHDPYDAVLKYINKKLSYRWDMHAEIDLVAFAFGWENTRKLCIETRGFKTNVKTAMEDYPIIDSSIPHGDLMKAIKRLSECDGTVEDAVSAIREIEYENDDQFFSSFGNMREMVDEYGEETVTKALKKQKQELLLENFKSYRDREHLEATQEHGKKVSRKKAKGETDVD